MKVDIKKIEANAIDVVSATTPWLAPVIPAYMTYTHTMSGLGFPWPVAFVAAIVVEFIGLAAIYTAVQMKDFNDGQKADKENRLLNLDKKDKDKAKKRKQKMAPLPLSIVAMAFYIIIVLTVNSGLQMEEEQGGFTVRVFSNGMLALLSVISGVIIAIRSQHARLLSERQDKRQARQVTRHVAPKVQDVTTETTPPPDKDEFVTIWKSNGHHSVPELAKELGVNVRTAQRWIAKDNKSNGNSSRS